MKRPTLEIPLTKEERVELRVILVATLDVYRKAGHDKHARTLDRILGKLRGGVQGKLNK